MKTIDVDFKYSGWELSPDCLIFLQKILIERTSEKLDVIEFGSGKSTDILLKFKEINNISGVYDCFDADQNFAHPYAKIKNIKSYNPYSNDYIFYDLIESDFSSNNYDLVILDGHHGHGRSVAWSYLINKLSKGCLVIIDDFDHYSFIEDFTSKFPNNKLVCTHWEPSNRWVVYEII